MQKGFKKKFFLINILKIFLIFFSISVFLFFISKLNFSLIEDGKIIDKKNIILFFLTKNFIVKNLMEKESDIIKISFKINFKNLKINIEKTREKPVALICHKESCYFLGEHSYIYKKTNISKNLLIIKSPYPVYENSYLKPELTSSLSNIFEYSNIHLIPLKEIQILSNLDLLIKTKFFSFLIDPYKNTKEQLDKLTFFLENYKNPQGLKIDLRIPQKIFFK